MKRIKDFLIAFLLFILISYAAPVFFPQTSSSVKNKEGSNEQIIDKEPTFIQGKLTAEGYSKWIGKTADKFREQFGEPGLKRAVSQTQEWWSYGEKSEDYYEVLVVNNIIESILIVGQNVETDGLHTGMRMDDLTMMTTIYSNFSFDYERENYIIELSEEDMNYQPLIAFDNGTFAMVHFSQVTGEVIAIRYLSALDLLTLMPYQLLSGNLLDVSDSLLNLAEINDQERAAHFVGLLNVLRQTHELSELSVDEELNQLAAKFAQQFLQHQDQILSEERYETMLEEQINHTYERAFYLDKDELSALEKLTESNKREELSPFIYMPNHDTSFVAIHGYGELAYILPLDDEAFNHIGVAFKDDFIVVLLKP
ncbi:CAP-associated domain-containing protein [Vagococcus zengguangii]|uniref:Uncharacterized protein n=1 Tax=Vagococcus zengguangii TaxID=2571750 RepID=A0A4D7CSH9_9ENTE|nr:CAP-associated domain-containing protein [Vagococcus zengguangii]QCI86033.1 hypothetical protein FA707_03240 [Vagococcus zengguangii]TLG80223.1 hypothetical protein FE258_05920 [Vagococcus zengguangii]